jgi:hypothetical protein
VNGAAAREKQRVIGRHVLEEGKAEEARSPGACDDDRQVPDKLVAGQSLESTREHI